MSHGIIKPIDKVISTKGAEWHGLADVVPTIGRTEAEPLFFDIRSGKVLIDIDGAQVPMPNHKPLVADFRACRPDLVGTENEFVPLHIPKNSYREIKNSEVWGAMEESIKDIDATVTCIGTLEAGKKFFISLDLSGETEFNAAGDKFLAHLNFITSHDGTLGVRAYDSTVRIVCMNTLRWSLNAAGDVGFNVYHTAGADTAMKNLGALVAEVLSGRAQFRDSMEFLNTVACSAEEARLVTLGYLSQLNTEGAKLSTRTKNAAEEIATLFSRGAGNKGKTLYDLLNGATEYWTNGDGTGKKADSATKAYKANFGSAADHKSAFCNLLLSGADVIAETREKGRKAEMGAVGSTL